MRNHVYYRQGDPDVPPGITDGYGSVVLSQCRICGQAECQLAEECPGSPTPKLFEALHRLVTAAEAAHAHEWEWECVEDFGSAIDHAKEVLEEVSR